MKKILIIEDDPGISRAMKVVLSEEGYKVRTLLDGRLYRGEIEKFKPDIVFLDLLMSGSDGRVVCLRIKNNPKTKDIKVVMVSAHPLAKESISKCGADDFLAKPFEMEDLIAIAEKYSGKK